MPICACLGEAAGAAIAIAGKTTRNVHTIDIGAHRKLINKCAAKYLCRDCLATELGWDREYLDKTIQMYRERGCMLFPPI